MYERTYIYLRLITSMILAKKENKTSKPPKPTNMKLSKSSSLI